MCSCMAPAEVHDHVNQEWLHKTGQSSGVGCESGYSERGEHGQY